MKTVDPLARAYRRRTPPPIKDYAALATEATALMRSESFAFRPADRRGLPGALVRLVKDIPTVVVPDLHARRDFLMALFELPLEGGQRLKDALDSGELQVLCLGDGFHAESRALERWQEAYQEYLGDWREHAAMNHEMTESMGLMEMVMHAKLRWPERFHFLKGNHENVKNESENGNFPFRKFVEEGDMVRSWVERFYGPDFLERYAQMELSLPLFAVGGRFLASHAEPARPYTEDEIINARLVPETVRGLTWTDNNRAEPGTVPALLARFLPEVDRPVYLSGHRTISGYYRERSDGAHLQIHNPSKRIVAWVMPDRDVNPAVDIGEIRGPVPDGTRSRGSD
ncbi:MAG TPA: metallophosphoesterase [Spirochaetales bacterium]|nr:metallophosphoesterase [Spirochaetales bacterium]